MEKEGGVEMDVSRQAGSERADERREQQRWVVSSDPVLGSCSGLKFEHLRGGVRISSLGY
eukprot:2042137-Rhodomonas_salina.2